jgi:TfoX/Sxy family transcriptional regulator of competence genes
VAFDEGLVERIRGLIYEEPGISERKMFGGLCFMTNGNMCFGIVGSELMLRVGVDEYAETLALAHVREMDFTGRSMRGMVYVAEGGISEDDDLSGWLRRGLDYAGSLPPK